MPRRAGVYKMRPEVARYLRRGVTYDPLIQPLYDRLTFATGVVGVQTFFAVPSGQGSPAKTELDTNLTLAGQIPSDHVFECWSPRIVLAPVNLTTTAVFAASNIIEDVNDLLRGAFFRFRIVSQEKLKCPIFWLPAGVGVSGFAAMTSIGGAGTNTGNVLALTNGEPNGMAAARLDPFPIVIPPLQTFSVTIEVPAAVTLSANVDVWVVLGGILHRPALP